MPVLATMPFSSGMFRMAPALGSGPTVIHPRAYSTLGAYFQ